MPEKTDLRKLLILRGPAMEEGGILSLLREHFELKIVTDYEEALAAMRKGSFDAVLAETTDFLPLERGIVTQQASVVLDTIADGVGIVAPEGDLLWGNRQLKAYSPDVLESLKEICVRAYEEFVREEGGSSEHGRRFSLMPEGGSYFEVVCSPILDKQGVVRQVAAVVANATSQRRQQLKLNAIDRAGRELVRLDYDAIRQLDAAQRLRMLEERIIRYSREVLNYQHFVVMLLDEKSNFLNVLIAEGLDMDIVKDGLFASPESNGICGYVAATGRSYICQDVAKDSRYIQGLRGARSSLTVPLRLEDKIIGVMNVESDKVGAFGEEDRQFAEIFDNYVALALNILNLLVSERHTTHTQVSGSVSMELAGPINDIISEATELQEEYIGQDDLRRRLGVIIDTACRTRRFLRDLADATPRGGVVRSTSTPGKTDPAFVGKRILVADDEEVIRRTVRDVLMPYGCQVDLAADGTEAKVKIASGNYDLVISDIKMPGATGYEVFEAAKKKREETKVILITGFGYDPHHSIVRANQEGLNAVLMKPFKAKQLIDECRTALSAG